MTEKRLRQLSRHGPGCYDGSPTCVCGLRDALFDEPDVVKVLRWLKQGEQEAINELEAFFYKHLARDIEREFGLELTGEGWDYTEERE
jgi:hypothetical protein